MNELTYGRAMNSNKLLLQEIEDFLDRTGMAEGRFGKKSCGDRHLIRRLRSGGGVTLRTADKIDAFITDYEADLEKKSDVCGEFV